MSAIGSSQKGLVEPAGCGQDLEQNQRHLVSSIEVSSPKASLGIAPGNQSSTGLIFPAQCQLTDLPNKILHVRSISA
ncbi:hypothetical protein DUNSADRAFT_17442 [Dunaliella salina]|uniref:Encoded protein n=1 Tax=Dunaliella salina TaxID=3046 RepID=A0ABQ7H053_DUNSA|nr:hypothetical protein DUNSADRAFT_17442 [Dunaliella salina]|eukprot:KAF5840225.1 hypothetical protein DUNSADRAFT_17442 [Dunaliella salina]